MQFMLTLGGADLASCIKVHTWGLIFTLRISTSFSSNLRIAKIWRSSGRQAAIPEYVAEKIGDLNYRRGLLHYPICT